MVDTSQLFEILADDSRRRILFLLVETDSIRVPDGLLSRGQTQQRRGNRSVRNLELRLHHTHLPKLADEGVIEWDRETGSVSRGPAFEEIEPVLRLLTENRYAFPGDPV